MGMGLGEHLKVTLFGESHGKCVGALFEGIPPGTEIDLDALVNDLSLENLEEEECQPDWRLTNARFCQECMRERQQVGRC